MLVTLVDEAYPDLLKTLADPPLVLWINGTGGNLSETCVGLVGSRDALPASLAIARKLGRELSDAGVTVVSGLAVGVDGAAHAGALDGAGRTIAVLGSGIARIYPPSHRDLARRIQERGAVVTELPPAAAPLADTFSAAESHHQRVVACGCRRRGRRQERVAHHRQDGARTEPRRAGGPGSGPLSGRYRGCHGLIKDGARLVETVEDILDEIQLAWLPAVDNKDSNPLEISDLEANMALGETIRVDELAVR